MRTLLTDREVDHLLRYPRGRSRRLAKDGLIVHIVLPDGEIRFDEDEIKKLLTSTAAQATESEVPASA